MMVTNDYEIVAQTADLTALCQAIDMNEQNRGNETTSDVAPMEDVIMGCTSNSGPMTNSSFSSTSPSIIDFTNVDAVMMRNMPSPQLEKAGLEGLFAILQAMDNYQQPMELDDVNNGSKKSGSGGKKGQKTRSYNWNGSNINPLLQVGSGPSVPINSIGPQVTCNFTNARDAVDEHFSRSLGRSWKSLASSSSVSSLVEKDQSPNVAGSKHFMTSSEISAGSMSKSSSSLYTSSNVSLASSSSTINSGPSLADKQSTTTALNINQMAEKSPPMVPEANSLGSNNENQSQAFKTSANAVNNNNNNNHHHFVQFRSPRSSSNNSAMPSNQASPYIGSFSLPPSSSGSTSLGTPTIANNSQDWSASNGAANRSSFINPSFTFKLGSLGIGSNSAITLKGKENSVNASGSPGYKSSNSTLGSHLPCLPPIPSSTSATTSAAHAAHSNNSSSAPSEKIFHSGVSLVVRGNNPSSKTAGGIFVAGAASTSASTSSSAIHKSMFNKNNSAAPNSNNNSNKAIVIPNIPAVNSPRNPGLHFIAPAPPNHYYHQSFHFGQSPGFNHSNSGGNSFHNHYHQRAQMNQQPQTQNRFHSHSLTNYGSRLNSNNSNSNNSESGGSTSFLVGSSNAANGRRALSPVKPDSKAKPC